VSAVLVDTSVWTNHFRRRDAHLEALLLTDDVLVHPLVLGELACFSQVHGDRGPLHLLQQLRFVTQATIPEVIGFIEREKLFGTSCDLVDMCLLASTRITPDALLWTADKRLHAVAESFGIAYRPNGSHKQRSTP
jgi:predicted nucleic acid-binding protein